MGDFGTFYQNGGVFMHGILLCFLAGSGYAIKAITDYRARKQPRLRAIRGLARAALVIGGLATAFGFIEMFAALDSIAAAGREAGFLRGMAIVPIPISFALMAATPLVVAHALLGHLIERRTVSPEEFAEAV